MMMTEFLKTLHMASFQAQLDDAQARLALAQNPEFATALHVLKSTRLVEKALERLVDALLYRQNQYAQACRYVRLYQPNALLQNRHIDFSTNRELPYDVPLTAEFLQSKISRE